MMDRINSTQYPSSGYQNSYTQYPQGYSGTSYCYQAYGQYASQNSQPTSQGDGFSGNNWNSAGYGATGSNQKYGVAQEMLHQKVQLTRQREEHVRKAVVLRRELDQLQGQKQELVAGGSRDRDLENILGENDKLQEEIHGKMKAIYNVIEMLSGIIKDGQTIPDLEASLAENEAEKSLDQLKHQPDGDSGSLTPEMGKNSKSGKYCYVHYDTGLHWCRTCDEFPETAKDFLLHLQDKKHKETAKDNDIDNTPWHKLPAEPVLPSDEGAPKKRIPIKGLQFFVSATSWYCKLCDVWIGDLHCASHHLKSQTHFQNYENFVSQNPQWEMEWFKDREKSIARKGEQHSSDSEGDKKKKKKKDKQNLSEQFSLKNKKKKKRSKKRRRHSSDSSSSSSDSSSSDDGNSDPTRSIRVAMRNMKKVESIMDEDFSSKWSVLEKLVEEHKKKENDKVLKPPTPPPDDPLINQWMTVSQPLEKDKVLLESLKDRMKQKQEIEKARLAEMEHKRREKERQELEMIERQQREARETAGKMERERRRHEQEEYEHIRDKERSQVKFKTSYKRRQSPLKSDEEDMHREIHHKNERKNLLESLKDRINQKQEMEKNRIAEVEQRRRDKEKEELDRRVRDAAEKLERETKRQDQEELYRKDQFRTDYRRRRSRSHSGDEDSHRDKYRKDERQRRDSESRSSRKNYKSRSRSRSSERKDASSNETKKKPPGPPSYKKLPFIGRMPLFKNKKPSEEHEEKKEIKKESYDQPRRTRFQPGNLARAFLPKPDVVCFPKLSSIPPLTFPPPPPSIPDPPKIGPVSSIPPPPTPMEKMEEKSLNLSDDEILYAGPEGVNPDMMDQFYHNYGGMIYSDAYQYSQHENVNVDAHNEPHAYALPLQPPPLPPDDDLALLGICADDMAAQSF